MFFPNNSCNGFKIVTTAADTSSHKCVSELGSTWAKYCYNSDQKPHRCAVDTSSHKCLRDSQVLGGSIKFLHYTRRAIQGACLTKPRCPKNLQLLPRPHSSIYHTPWIHQLNLSRRFLQTRPTLSLRQAGMMCCEHWTKKEKWTHQKKETTKVTNPNQPKLNQTKPNRVQRCKNNCNGLKIVTTVIKSRTYAQLTRVPTSALRNSEVLGDDKFLHYTRRAIQGACLSLTCRFTRTPRIHQLNLSRRFLQTRPTLSLRQAGMMCCEHLTKKGK